MLFFSIRVLETEQGATPREGERCVAMDSKKDVESL
jgi:hypothetical protein